MNGLIDQTVRCRDPLVSVVIPTRSRPSLVGRAVQSALSQSLDEIEVIVVVDGPDESTLQVLNQIEDSRLRVIMLPQNLGVSEARNIGVSEAKSQWIAFLDDDDEWLPQKLEIQLHAAQRSPHEFPIIVSRIIARSKVGDFVWPLRLPRPNEFLSEYLFCRRNPISGEGLITIITLLTKKELLQKISFRDLGYHEDTDWLLRACIQKGVDVEFVSWPDPLAIYYMDDDHSRKSTAIDWRYSLSWIQANRHLVTARAFASFIMTRPALYASRQKDWKAFLPLLLEAYRHYRPGPLDLLSYFTVWLAPQWLKEQLASYYARRSRNSALKKGGE